MRRRRAGFTFVEILTAMTIIAILAGIVVPKLADTVTRAKATVIATSVQNVSEAVANYSVTHTTYPPTAAMGVVPDSLQQELGANAFLKTDYALQYNNWKLWTMLNGRPSLTSIVGVTVQIKDQRLGQLVLAQLAKQYPHFQWGTNYTFIVYGL